MGDSHEAVTAVWHRLTDRTYYAKGPELAAKLLDEADWPEGFGKPIPAWIVLEGREKTVALDALFTRMNAEYGVKAVERAMRKQMGWSDQLFDDWWELHAKYFLKNEGNEAGEEAPHDGSDKRRNHGGKDRHPAVTAAITAFLVSYVVSFLAGLFFLLRGV